MFDKELALSSVSSWLHSSGPDDQPDTLGLNDVPSPDDRLDVVGLEDKPEMPIF